MSHPAELHLAAIQRQYDEAVARIDHLSDLWGPRVRQPVDEEAPDPLGPDAVTTALAVGRGRQRPRTLTSHGAGAACPQQPAPCPEHGAGENVVEEQDVVAERTFVTEENFVVDPPARDGARVTVWGFALPNKRRRLRRPAR